MSTKSRKSIAGKVIIPKLITKILAHLGERILFYWRSRRWSSRRSIGRWATIFGISKDGSLRGNAGWWEHPQFWFTLMLLVSNGRCWLPVSNMCLFYQTRQKLGGWQPIRGMAPKSGNSMSIFEATPLLFYEKHSYYKNIIDCIIDRFGAFHLRPKIGS